MVDDMQRYIAETMKFSRALNLTAIHDAEEFSRRFIGPSVALCNWIPDSGVLLDVGSGMCVPGIPILIRRPGVHGVLVERRKKRAEYLRHIVRLLKLDAEVHDCDMRDLSGVSADIGVARAVTRPDELLPMMAQSMGDKGRAILPVPETIDLIDIHGWKLESIDTIVSEGIKQRIHCYCKEGVSRET